MSKNEKPVDEPFDFGPPPPFVPSKSWRESQRRRKALMVEVSPRTFEAAKARPEKLEVRVQGEDEHGNAVIERPARTGTISEEALMKKFGEVEGRRRYEQIRAESIRRCQKDWVPQELGRPQDQ
jgi:hypothetical protein